LAKKQTRRRRYLYEAICEAVYEKRWRDVKGMAKGRANKCEKELLLLGLADTPEGAREFKRRVKRWHQVFAWKEPLVNPLVVIGDWEALGAVKQTTVQPGGPTAQERSRHEDWWREFQERAWAWWRTLSAAEREKRVRNYGRTATPQEIANLEYQRPKAKD
jgi:hypothetical protein